MTISPPDRYGVQLLVRAHATNTVPDMDLDIGATSDEIVLTAAYPTLEDPAREPRTIRSSWSDFEDANDAVRRLCQAVDLMHKRVTPADILKQLKEGRGGRAD